VLDAPFFREGRLAFEIDDNDGDDGRDGGGGGGDGGRPPILETEDGRFVYCDLTRLKLVSKSCV
jgi:hypothetical protein